MSKIGKFGKQDDGAINLKFFDSTGKGIAQFGQFQDGTIGLKVSKEGVEVGSATNDQLIFNSSQDIFKIVSVVNQSYTITVADYNNAYANFSFNHNLGFAPTVVGSFSNSSDGASRPLPYIWQNQTQSYYSTLAPGGDAHIGSASIQIYSVDTAAINIVVKIHDLLGLSWLLNGSILNFKLYCLQETIAS